MNKEMTKGQKAAIQTLADHFGEGAIISRNDLVMFMRSLRKQKAPNISNMEHLRRSPMYRLGRAMYVVTTQEDATEIREAKKAELEAGFLPANDRDNVAKIVSIIKKVDTAKPKMKAPAKKKNTTLGTKKKKAVKQTHLKNVLADNTEFDDMDHLFGSDDISDILLTM